MGDRGIKIAGIQETHQTVNSIERRKNYKWFYSGEKGGKEGSRYAGVAFVVHNEMLNYIKDIEPINDRMMILTIGYSMETTIIDAYAPTADKDEEVKKEFYDELEKQYNKYTNKGPTIIIGDLNARIQIKNGKAKNV